ncbi:MAG TPA: polyprenyl synthetase family protein [Ktedonobacteraceae bacterium]|nr:polyprenyl synthetase family protein [Ktedonobacteraceae bacterium]
MVEVLSLAEARSVLSERVLACLDGLDAALREDVRGALALEGKLLHQPGTELDGRWALLPFCLARALNTTTRNSPASFEAARDVALAMECVVCATDLLDDVMDDDVTTLIEQLGMARVLNVALALVSLSQRMLLALLELDVPITLPARLMDMMQRAILLASSGQQRDLLAERRPACELTREECLEIAAAKAGALLSLACQMGAVCAGVGDAELALCAETGRLLGIAAQLDNDAHDLSELLLVTGQKKQGKSDLARGKKTLPIVLAAHSLGAGPLRDVHALDFRHLERLSGEIQERALQALREGIIATWGIALLYRERARETLVSLLDEQALSPDLLHIMGLEYELVERNSA